KTLELPEFASVSMLFVTFPSRTADEEEHRTRIGPASWGNTPYKGPASPAGPLCFHTEQDGCGEAGWEGSSPEGKAEKHERRPCNGARAVWASTASVGTVRGPSRPRRGSVHAGGGDSQTPPDCQSHLPPFVVDQTRVGRPRRSLPPAGAGDHDDLVLAT